MQPFRGVLMAAAAGIAFYRGWQMRGAPRAWLALGLGAAALLLALWHFTRSSAAPRSR